MAKYICFLLLLLTISSCTKHTFLSYYHKEKHNADWAIAFPKYLAMVAIPKDAKEDVKYFTKGMRKIRVLFSEKPGKVPKERLKEFMEENAYEPYIVIRDDGDEFNLYTIEDENHIKEIILDFHSRDEAIVVALLGKMEKQTFREAIDEFQKSK